MTDTPYAPNSIPLKNKVSKMKVVARFWDSDIIYSFRQSSIASISFFAMVSCMIIGAGAPWFAPYNPHDLSQISLLNSLIPPSIHPDGSLDYILGTDAQGRDLLSAIIYGLRSSIFISIAAVAFALFIGISLGLVSGYYGGISDIIIMRICDVKLSFPTLLIAMLTSGIITATTPPHLRETFQVYILIFAIGFSSWPKFARTIRSGVLVEKEKEYVIAASIIGVKGISIMLRHIFPNVLPSLLVITTLSFGLAIIDEATISFLGAGLPPSQPSLGTLISNGNEAFYSGEWWIALFPTIVLIILVLAINLFGDWLRDALNPRLR